MKIRALKPFTMRDAETGALTSIACGSIAVMDDEVGAQLITDGLAEEYKLIEPTGSKTITANGTVDVTEYASAVVNVGTLTITYDANGGTGSVDAQVVIAGNSAELNDGTGLTAPEGKEFVGWATTSTAETPDVESPYTPSDNVTLYAVYVASV
jgi:hypothetical protein